MSGGLFTVAQDGQAPGVRARQSVGGDGARGGGADGGDLSGMEDADRGSAVGIEQQHDALVRLHALGEVLREDAEDLGSERRPLTHRARHDAERPAVGEGDNRAQSLQRLAL